MRTIRYAIAGALFNVGAFIAIGPRGPRVMKQLVWSGFDAEMAEWKAQATR
jgi:hypothetical protein